MMRADEVQELRDHVGSTTELALLVGSTPVQIARALQHGAKGELALRLAGLAFERGWMDVRPEYSLISERLAWGTEQFLADWCRDALWALHQTMRPGHVSDEEDARLHAASVFYSRHVYNDGQIAVTATDENVKPNDYEERKLILVRTAALYLITKHEIRGRLTLTPSGNVEVSEAVRSIKRRLAKGADPNDVADQVADEFGLETILESPTDHFRHVDYSSALPRLQVSAEGGTASPEQVADLLFGLSEIYRAAGGSGIEFNLDGLAVPELVNETDGGPA